MFKGYVSARYLVPSKEDKSCLDWAEGDFSDDVKVADGETLKECLDKLSKETEGSRWCLYPSLYVMEDNHGQVWESTCVLYKCDSCKREEWDRIEDKVPA